MKEEKLLDALGKIEDELVLEAAPKAATSEPVQKNALHGGENKGNRKQRALVKWAAMAACVCLLAGAGVLGWKTHFFSIDTPVDEISLLEKDYTTVQMEEWSQDTSIPQQEFTINQNMTASGDELVLLDDIMQNGGIGYPDWGVILSAKDVTPSGLTLICSQSGGAPSGELMTGEDYYLIVWREGHWRMVVPVIENYAWNSLAHWISEDADTMFEIDWKWLYGELEPGTYRLVKEFMDFRKTADYDKAVYWMEFVIE